MNIYFKISFIIDKKYHTIILNIVDYTLDYNSYVKFSWLIWNIEKIYEI